MLFSCSFLAYGWKWGILLKPNPHTHTRKNMNKKMAPKLSSLSCFEAFGVVFCPDFCSYFCLVCAWGGFTRISEEAFCLQWSFFTSFLLTVDNFSFFTYNWSFFCLRLYLSYLQLELLCLQWEGAANKGLKGTVSQEA